MRMNKIAMKSSVDMEKYLGSLEVFMEAEPTELTKGKYYMWAQLLNAQGKEVDRIFPMEVEAQTQFCMEVQEPELWNPEYPVFYELVLEMRDEEQQLLGCTSKKVGFYHAAIRDNSLLLNDKKMHWRKVPDEVLEMQKEKLGENLGKLLTAIRRNYYNCIYLQPGQDNGLDEQLCMEYGILCLDDRMRTCLNVCETTEISHHPDFEIRVVENGALIENRSVFMNTNRYALKCEILSENRIVQQSVVEADIPAGGKRYLELPFVKLRDPGMYRYRVSLCLKKHEMWGKKGEMVAKGESLISNMWFNH